jgi:proteasome lid subunit RPN8/RPN11
MNFFNRGIMSRGPRLRIPIALWEQLLDGLRKRGQGVRESGAFLMGMGEGAERTMTGFVLYDDLDPNCLNEGYVRFDGRHYARLWEICQRAQVSVVADVHTHPYGAGQSHSDRMHPMISIPGHIALIVPNYAQAPVFAVDVGVYVYRGRYRWATYRGVRATRVLDLQQADVPIQ